MKLRAAGLGICFVLCAVVGCGGDAPVPSTLPNAGTTAAAAGFGAPIPGAGATGVLPPGSAGRGAIGPGMAAAGGGSVPNAGGSAGPLPVAGTGSGEPPVVGVTPSALGSVWGSFGGDLNHSRTMPGETMLTTENVSDMKVAFDIKAPGVTATPAIYKGVAYWADWEGVVYATNVYDKSEVWRLDNSAANKADYIDSGYTGSPAVTESAVYVANRNGLLSAIDRLTGTPLWEVTIDAGPHTHVWSSPVVAEQDNVLVVGVGGIGTRDNDISIPRSQLESFHGRVEGFELTTGKSLWKFETSPMPNGAGVSVWSSAALDTTRKLALIGTGNNYYAPVSEYSDSLLALDYVTGAYKWHSQFTMGDAWTYATLTGGGVDGDVGATPNLFTIGTRDVVGVGDKRGNYHVRDRETGDVVWDRSLTNGGFQGGVMAPAAYFDGTIYVISNNGTISSSVFALNVADGEDKWPAHSLSYPTFGGPALANGVLYVGDSSGNIAALDIADGMPLWDSSVPQGRGGGFSVADGMLFTGYGYHFSESAQEPLTGGLMAFSLNGTLAPPTGPAMMSECVLNTALTTAPSFTNVYQGVLCAAGCANVCHAVNKTAGLGFDTKAGAYTSLVGSPAKGACMASGGTLVTPNNPNTSILYQKISLTQTCGDPMPPGTTAATTPFTPAMLDVVRAWITAGAPND